MGNQPQSAPSVQNLFAAALDLAPPQRAAFLQAACAGAPATLHLIEELLAEHDRAGSFLASPLFGSDPANEVTVTSASSAGDHFARGNSTIVLPRFRPMQLIAGRFQVVRFIARGGMGEVYEVRDQHLHGERLALKIIRPEIAANAGTSQRFEQEVVLARKVRHTNLCPIYDFSRCDDPPPAFLLLTMKLLEGETLDARLKSSQPIPVNEATDICNQLIRGVGAIHEAGVIHRDLKPNNVMLERATDPHHPRLCVYIMDFGLARLHESEQSVARTGIAGTPGYIAPELFSGQRPTQATDLYALGIVLHQVLTGERPEDQQRALGVKPTLALRSSAAPPDLIQAVENLLSEDPEQRCRAFDNLHAAVESPHPLSIRTRPLLTRRRFLITAGASACALTTAAVWRRHQLYDTLYDWRHPLPPKRFVAVLNWPPTKDPKIRPMVNGLLDAISNELSRAEAYDHNFFVITPPHQTADLNAPKDLVEASESLGTNLVLAASATTIDNHLRVFLRVLDPTTPRTLRAHDIRASLNEVFSLPQRAVHVAAELLDVTHYNPNDERSRTGTDNPEALAAFQAAELLRKQPNDTGLDPAIEKYKEALELDPHYAKAQAALAWADLRSFGLHRSPATLTLGRENSEDAIALDPSLPEAHTARAWALEEQGEHQQAQQEIQKALALDPDNPRTLTYQGRIYEGVGRYDMAEGVYQRITQRRPNFWLGHQEFGALHEDEGNLRAALREMQLASSTAPGNAQPPCEIGAIYLCLGDLDQAAQYLQASLDLQPTPDAAVGFAEVSRLRNNPAAAIGYAQQAVTLEPKNALAWLELGDVYSAARKSAQALSAYQHTVTAQTEELQSRTRMGRGWMVLALSRVKAGDADSSYTLIQKAEAFYAVEMSSQLFKVRTLELLGRRDEALAAVGHCLARGATPFQFNSMLDIEKLRADPRYNQMMQSAPVAQA